MEEATPGESVVEPRVKSVSPGGFEAWEAAGYPVEGGEREEPESTEAKSRTSGSRSTSEARARSLVG
jgi:3-mercaptopyruvate sulfurtransferase SseA